MNSSSYSPRWVVGTPGARRAGRRGFFVIETIVATTLLVSVTILGLAMMRRMDQNLARTRCETHLGMIANQHAELFRYVPYDVLADAAATPTSAGYIRFGGGANGGTEVPYRVEANYTVLVDPDPRREAAQVQVNIYWSPPLPSNETALVPGPGPEKLFRSVVVNRFRY